MINMISNDCYLLLRDTTASNVDSTSLERTHVTLTYKTTNSYPRSSQVGNTGPAVAMI